MNKRISAIIGLVIWASACTSSENAANATEYKTVEQVIERLSDSYPSYKHERIEESEIPGVFAVYSGNDVVYYAPAQDVLIFGEFYDKTGQSLTQQRIEKVVSENVSDLNRDAALTIGNGDKELVMFLDPDCGYCKQAYEWLSEQDTSQYTQRIYFQPLGQRKKARSKVLTALCADKDDAWEALGNVFTRFQPEAEEKGCIGADKHLAANVEESRRLGVNGTPTFVIDGQLVSGFEPELLATFFN